MQTTCLIEWGSWKESRHQVETKQKVLIVYKGKELVLLEQVLRVLEYKDRALKQSEREKRLDLWTQAENTGSAGARTPPQSITGGIVQKFKS